MPRARNAGRKKAPSGPTRRTLSSSACAFASTRRERRSHAALRASSVSGAVPLVHEASSASRRGWLHSGASSQASAQVAPSRSEAAAHDSGSAAQASANASRARGMAAPQRGGGDEVAGKCAVHPLLDAATPGEDPLAGGDARRPRGHTDEGTHPPRPASRVELPGRGSQRERRHDPDEGESRKDARGHERAGGGDATRLLERLRVVDDAADRVEHVGERSAEAMAESAGEGDGRCAHAGCGRSRCPFCSTQTAPARRRARPFVEDGRVGIIHADAPSHLDACQREAPGCGSWRSRAQTGRDLGDEERELARGGRALSAASVARRSFLLWTEPTPPPPGLAVRATHTRRPRPRAHDTLLARTPTHSHTTLKKQYKRAYSEHADRHHLAEAEAVHERIPALLHSPTLRARGAQASCVVTQPS